LATHWQASPVAQATIAANFHQPANAKVDLAPQVAFYLVVSIDNFT
jgi:hypothetical protein